MKKTILNIVLTFVIFIFIGVLFFIQFNMYKDIQTQFNKLFQEVDIFNSDNIILSERISSLENKIKSSEKQFEEYEEKNSKLEQEISELTSKEPEPELKTEEKEKEEEEILSNPDAQISSTQTTSNQESDIYYGRFYVPSVNISVGLYRGTAQYITDNFDSANIFYHDGSEVIADHNNQEFSKLYGVTVGTTAYIETVSGEIINMQCTEAFNGHSSGHSLYDGEGYYVFGVSDYLTYTCLDSWQNVYICLWEKI